MKCKTGQFGMQNEDRLQRDRLNRGTSCARGVEGGGGFSC